MDLLEHPEALEPTGDVALRSNGFTPKDAEVRVSGKLVVRSGQAALEVSGSKSIYLLKDPPRAKGRAGRLQKAFMGKEVTLRGRVPEEAEASANTPRVLEVLD